MSDSHNMSSDGSMVASAGELPRWGRIIAPGTGLQIGIIVALLMAAYWIPINDAITDRWINDPNWSHGWLVPLFSLYFLFTRSEQLRSAKRSTSWLGLVVLLGALTTYFWFFFIDPRQYPQAVTIVIAVFGITLFLGGRQIIRLAWFPILYLLVAVPLPTRVYVDATMPLRRFASLVSAWLLDLLPGVHTDVSGVTIDYFSASGGHGTLNVEEACSGMRLMMAFMALGLAMAFLGNRPAWQRVVMVLFCIPIAVFCNMIRVTRTGVIHVYHWDALSSGAPHELLGLAMLPIALGLFALVGYILNNLFVDGQATA